MISKGQNEVNKKVVSVVIATLGGTILSETIHILNQGSICPDEILICIPRHFIHKLPKELPVNVRVVPTDFMGQVSQRIAGFKEVKNSLVFQMDDDVHVNQKTLECLVKGMDDLGGLCSISPALIDRSTGESVYKNVSSPSWLLKIYYFMISGSSHPKPGSILSCGVGLGYNPSVDCSSLVPVEWLPGGCIMHNKAYLVKEEFYPFSGKAYCEDLIHSHKLVENDVKLFIAKNAFASIVVEEPFGLTARSFLLYLTQDYKARNYFLMLKKLPKSRMIGFYLLQVFIYLGKKFKFIIKRSSA